MAAWRCSLYPGHIKWWFNCSASKKSLAAWTRFWDSKIAFPKECSHLKYVIECLNYCQGMDFNFIRFHKKYLKIFLLEKLKNKIFQSMHKLETSCTKSLHKKSLSISMYNLINKNKLYRKKTLILSMHIF